MAFELVPGGRLGRYELLLLVAKSGMAEIWAARPRSTPGFQRLVALRAVLASQMPQRAAVALRLEQARSAALPHHPNVVTTLDIGEQHGVLYIVQQWVHGETLGDIHRAALASLQRVPVRLCVNIVAQACMGLHAVHEAKDRDGACLGLAHGSISPQNLLVGYSGTVKVSAFGSVTASGLRTVLNEPLESTNEVAFRSPEQLAAQSLDPRSDVFALGTLLYLITTGCHPFLGETIGGTIDRIQACNPPKPSSFVRDYPPALERVLCKTIAKDPEQRWKCAAELGAALAEIEPNMHDGPSGRSLADYVRAVMGDADEQRLERLVRAQHELDTADAAKTSVAPSSASPVVVTATTTVDNAHPASEGPSPHSPFAVVETTDERSRSSLISVMNEHHSRKWVAGLVTGVSLLVGFAMATSGFSGSSNARVAPQAKPVQVPPSEVMPGAAIVPTEQVTPDAAATEPTASDAGVDAAKALHVDVHSTDVPAESTSAVRRAPSALPTKASVDAWDLRQFGGRN